MKILFLVLFLFIYFNCFAQKPLQLYGGRGRDIYLGCLNCNVVDSNSIWNEVGTYGSYVSSLCIWNDAGEYGSDVSNYSPWNEIGSYPPAIADKDGVFYGYLTVNESHQKRAEFDLVLTIYKYHDLIKNKVAEWYNKIFQ